jgi:ethanolamine ammonia-lyase small subunit
VNEDSALAALRAATPARVALGRAGTGLPTAPLLAFELAHARARDAVHAALQVEALRAAISMPSVLVRTAAADRTAYLRNPDLGRRLAPNAPALVMGDFDLAIVVADGLSATAVEAHAPAVIAALATRLEGWSLAPVAIVTQGRVAIGDPVGEDLGARAVVVLIGERPGLSAADSLSAYITWAPRRGRRDAERNCVSNIRVGGGLAPVDGAARIAWLLTEARRLGFTGVALKDRSGAPVLAGPAALGICEGDEP